jgi:hypothetical protein
MSSALDPFIPRPDVREHFHTIVHAPAAVVMDAAVDFDLQSIPLVRAIIRMRAMFMRASPSAPRKPQGILAETRSLGWGLLDERPGRVVVCGAACRPWLGNVVFTPIPSGEFAAYAQPDQVKIAWSLEAESLGPVTTRFSHETRAVATDFAAQAKFRRYWRWARFGIVAIRMLLMPAVKREAERRWREAT